MTKPEIANLLYSYIVKKTRLSTILKQYPEETKASLTTIIKQSGFNRGEGLFAGNDCGAYAKLQPPKFTQEEMIEHITAYITEDENRPDMNFGEFISYRGVNAVRATRDIPKPMPQKIWHTSQSTAIFQAQVKEKKAPLARGTAVALMVFIAFVIIALGVAIFLVASHSDDIVPLNTSTVWHNLM